MLKWARELYVEEDDGDIVNAGIGGNTSGEGSARLERDVLSFSPDIVIINFGMNDHVICDKEGHPRTTLSDFRENLRQRLLRCRTAGAFPVLVTPNRILEEYYYERHPKEWFLGVCDNSLKFWFHRQIFRFAGHITEKIVHRNQIPWTAFFTAIPASKGMMIFLPQINIF